MTTTTDCLAVAIQAQLSEPFAPPVILWGSTGCGKSKTVEAICKSLALNLTLLRVPQMQEADFAGYPVPDMGTGTMRFLAPSFAQSASVRGPGKSCFLFDEMSDANRSIQAAAHGPLLDKEFGETKLKGVAMVAASNPPSISTTGQTISIPVANRFVHLFHNQTPDEWSQGMVSGWKTQPMPKLPSNWRQESPAYMALVAQFAASVRSELLDISEADLLAKGEESWKPFHTRRSWTAGAVLMGAATAVGDTTMKHMLLEGCVGPAAMEFLTWANNLDLPDPEEVLANPTTFPIPERNDQILAVCNAVVARVLSNNTAKRWNAGWQVLARIEDSGRGGIAAVGAPNLARNWPKDARGFPPAAKEFMPLLKQAGLLK